jgi:hypothetical protein
MVSEAMISNAIYHQSEGKAPGPDLLNFKAIRLLWNWNRERIVNITRQCVRLGYHPKVWKTAKGVVIRKINKPDYSQPKAYRVISLLNCLGKVVEKVITELISTTIEAKLHTGQLGCRKRRSVVDTAACLTNRVYKAWAKGKISGALLMDVKGAFDHVSKTQLTKRLQELEADPQIIKWTESFMTDRKASLLINGHENAMKPTKTGIPEGSPVSPILFASYISGIFEEIEEEVMGATGLSFVDEISWLATGKDVIEITKLLEACGKAAKTLAAKNAVEFDMIKTEPVIFTKKKKRADMAIDLGDGIRVQYNKGATRWLGLWLDSALNIKEHHNK